MIFKLTTSCSCKGNYTNGFRLNKVGEVFFIDIRHPNNTRELKKAKDAVKNLNFYDVYGYLEETLVEEAMKRNQNLTHDEALTFVKTKVQSETNKIQEALATSSVIEELEKLS